MQYVDKAGVSPQCWGIMLLFVSTKGIISALNIALKNDTQNRTHFVEVCVHGGNTLVGGIASTH